MDLTFGALYGSLGDPASGLDNLSKLEDWGYDSVWASEHILFYGPTLEGLTVLSFYAARTKKIRIGTAIYLLPLRHPTVVAKTVTTLDIMSGGRVTLGVGVGGEYPKEFEATGVPVRERGSRTNESMEVIKRLWTESNVTHEGKHYQFTDVTMEPRPIQKPHPPIVVAGRSEAAQRRAGRLGDGYMPYLFSPERYEKGAAVVQAAAADSGRDLAAENFDWSIYLFVAAAKDMESARKTAAAQLQLRYQQPFEHLVDKYCAMGPPDDCAARIVDFAKAGAREFILVPLVEPGGDYLGTLQHYAEEIVPRVKKAVR